MVGEYKISIIGKKTKTKMRLLERRQFMFNPNTIFLFFNYQFYNDDTGYYYTISSECTYMLKE